MITNALSLALFLFGLRETMNPERLSALDSFHQGKRMTRRRIALILLPYVLLITSAVIVNIK